MDLLYEPRSDLSNIDCSFLDDLKDAIHHSYRVIYENFLTLLYQVYDSEQDTVLSTAVYY